MPVIDLGQDTVSGVVTAIAATGSATSAPTGSTDGFQTGRFPRVRTLLLYSGQVDACNVRVWFRNRASGAWFRGADTASFDALAPGGASAVNESRDWETGAKQEIFFQIVSISGGGTAAVLLQPIDTASR